jgi:hypothetical protein
MMRKYNSKRTVGKKLKWIFILALLCHGSVQAQGLVPYRVGNQWGFSTIDGDIKIAPQYDSIVPFKFNRFLKERYAKIIKNGEESLIDLKGDTLSKVYMKKARKVTVDNYLMAIRLPNKTYEMYNLLTEKYYRENVTGYQFLKSVGLFVVRKGKQKGLLDEFFNELAPIEYKKFRIKKINVYSRKISKKDLDQLKVLGVTYSEEYQAYYLNEKEIGYRDPLVLITLINTEGSKNIVYRIPRESVTRPNREQIIADYVDHLDTERTGKPKFSNFKFQDCYSRSKRCLYSTNVNGQLQYGVYDFELDKSSPLYDQIKKDKGYQNYIVSKNGKEGRMQRNFELSIPIEYEEVISFAYESDILKLKKVNNHGGDTSKYRYDYYDVKTQKVVVEDALYFPDMNEYYYISKPRSYGFFLVRKGEDYFYMGIDGRKFFKN